MPLKTKVKRGDTIIEVTLAFAIFSLVAIITVAMMNMGLDASERSLELVTARNELNAQAEALRFIHSSYISEATLPTCDDPNLGPGEKCQQYEEVWKNITDGAVSSAADGGFSIEYPLDSCQEVYANGNQLLIQNNAFVLNTRQLVSSKSAYSGAIPPSVIVRATNGEIFREAPLGARIIYTSPRIGGDSTTDISSIGLNQYLYIAAVEGIWVVAVAGPDLRSTGHPQYYDFYIETCWYGSGNSAPTSLDSIIRLYNPEGA